MTRFVSVTVCRSAALLCVVLIGCGGGGGGSGTAGTGPVTDVTSPTIYFVSPSNAAAEVDISDVTQIAVGFNEAIDSNSITSSSFRVMDAGGVSVRGLIDIETPVVPSGQTIARFTPEQPLARSMEYRVALTTAIRDLAGNTLAADYNSSFTTISDTPWLTTSVTPSTASARWDHAAIWTGSEMIVYGGYVGYGQPATNTGARYNPTTDSWTAISSGSMQSLVAAVWTGNEMIVWTGSEGERYNPSNDSWTSVNSVGAPSVDFNHTVVWTGTEMIVWGGREVGSSVVNTGGRFDPASGVWSPTNSNSMSGAPSARYRHSAVWTGTEMIVWGGGWFPAGGGNITLLGDGARYNPTTDNWAPISTIGAPTPRMDHTAIWTGQEMIIWGGSSAQGARYNPTTDLWSPLAPSGFNLGFVDHAAIWTGVEMIVWGGWPRPDALGRLGGRYNPVTNTWRPVTRENNSIARDYHTGIWTGTELIIWGGHASTGYNPPGVQTGARYLP